MANFVTVKKLNKSTKHDLDAAISHCVFFIVFYFYSENLLMNFLLNLNADAIEPVLEMLREELISIVESQIASPVNWKTSLNTHTHTHKRHFSRLDT